MFDLIYACDDFVVINKHPNVSVHKDDGDTMLVHDVAKALQCEKLYLVHRLDKMTSGLLLLAKNNQAASALSQLFANKKIEKYYLALGSKKPKKKQGLIEGDMERSRRASWKLMPSKVNPAITQFFSLSAAPGERLFLCRPHSGKTHQIRVALKSVGSPIIGDPIYNPSSSADRGYLHAFALCFGFKDESFKFSCDPREFAACGSKWNEPAVSENINQWSEPWSLQWPKIK